MCLRLNQLSKISAGKNRLWFNRNYNSMKWQLLLQHSSFPIGEKRFTVPATCASVRFHSGWIDGCPGRCQESVGWGFVRVPGKFWKMGFVEEWDYWFECKLIFFHATRNYIYHWLFRRLRWRDDNPSKVLLEPVGPYFQKTKVWM